MTQSNDDTTADQLEQKLGIEIIGDGSPYTKKPLPQSWRQVFRAKGDSYGNSHGELWKHPDGFFVHTSENIDGLRYIKQIGEDVEFEAMLDTSEGAFDGPERHHSVSWKPSEKDLEQYEANAAALREDDEELRVIVGDVMYDTIVGDFGLDDAYWSGTTVSISTILDGFNDAEKSAIRNGADKHTMSAKIVLSDN